MTLKIQKLEQIQQKIMENNQVQSEEKSTMIRRKEINDSYYKVRQILINWNLDNESKFVETTWKMMKKLTTLRMIGSTKRNSC